MSIDIGATTFGKRVLLLGAGFSKNWGGMLANEVWQGIFGHEAVKKRPAVVALLKKATPSFETVLAEVRNGGIYDAADVAAVETAIAAVFARMDRQFRDPQQAVSIYTINDLISQFCPGPVGIGTGYVFSLNQDLLVERIYGTKPERQKITIPGVSWNSPPPHFPAADNDIPLATTIDPRTATSVQLHNCFNLIKLHGSINWRSGDGTAAMVMGDGKTTTIAGSPLLSWYAEVFERVLAVGNVRLMVIGYGWADEHINAAIARAVANHGLQVFIWNPADPRQALPNVSHGQLILDQGLTGVASQPLANVMPVPYNPITPEYARIRDEFF